MTQTPPSSAPCSWCSRLNALPLPRFCGAIVVLLTALALVAWVLLAAVYGVPSPSAEQHATDAAAVVKEESGYSRVSEGVVDDFTELLMLSEIALSGSDSIPTAFVDALKVPGVRFEVSDYTRYWHGYLVILKPLFALFTLLNVRMILFTAGIVLLASTCALLYKRLGSLGTLLAMALAISISVCGGFDAMQCMPTCFSFLVALGATCVLLSAPSLWRALYENCFRSVLKCSLLMFALIGAATSFFDYLDTPLVSVIIPTCILLASLSTRFSPKQTCVLVIACVCAWLIGFAYFWFLKIALAALVVGPSELGEAGAAIAFRSGSTDSLGFIGRTLKAWQKNISVSPLMTGCIALLTGALVVALIGVALRGCKNDRQQGVRHVISLALFLVLAATPYIWYAVMSNHSVEHTYSITYRTQGAAVFALGAGLSVASGALRKAPIAASTQPHNQQAS